MALLGTLCEKLPALEWMPRLKTLMLQGISLGDAGLVALAPAFYRSCSGCPR